jgi:hypothetical protein
MNVRQTRLLGRSRALFRKDDLSGLLPAGETQSLALPGAEYTLWITPGLLGNVYKRRVTNEPTEVLIPDPKDALGGIGDQQGDYVDLDNNGSWWKTAGRVFFHPNPAVSPAQELAEVQRHFFQPQAFVDPFGNRTLTSYDTFTILYFYKRPSWEIQLQRQSIIELLAQTC